MRAKLIEGKGWKSLYCGNGEKGVRLVLGGGVHGDKKGRGSALKLLPWGGGNGGARLYSFPKTEKAIGMSAKEAPWLKEGNGRAVPIGLGSWERQGGVFVNRGKLERRKRGRGTVEDGSKKTTAGGAKELRQ